MTRKCDYCGREGNAPHVRGAKSVAVQIGNYRMNVDSDIAICEKCADRLMRRAMDELILALTVEGSGR